MNFACGIPALSGMRKLNMTTSSDEQRSVTIANYWISHKRTFDEREGRSRDSCKCLILCHILFQFTETHISRIIFQYSNRGVSGRRGGLMVSRLASGSSGPGSSPGRRHCVVLCSWARHFTLTVPLSTQVYKWVPANLMLGGNPAMEQHPIQGGVEILSVASC